MGDQARPFGERTVFVAQTESNWRLEQNYRTIMKVIDTSW